MVRREHEEGESPRPWDLLRSKPLKTKTEEKHDRWERLGVRGELTNSTLHPKARPLEVNGGNGTDSGIKRTFRFVGG